MIWEIGNVFSHRFVSLKYLKLRSVLCGCSERNPLYAFSGFWMCLHHLSTHQLSLNAHITSPLQVLIYSHLFLVIIIYSTILLGFRVYFPSPGIILFLHPQLNYLWKWTFFFPNRITCTVSMWATIQITIGWLWGMYRVWIPGDLSAM